MKSTLSTDTTNPRRSSCNRCYRQKLRCPRRGNDPTAPCDRCLNKRAVCEYGSSLPKGRPSLYRLTRPSQDAKTSEPSRSSSITTRNTTTALAASEPPWPEDSSAIALDQICADDALGADGHLHDDSEVNRAMDHALDSAKSDDFVFTEAIDMLAGFDVSYLDAMDHDKTDKIPGWTMEWNSTIDASPQGATLPKNRGSADSCSTWVSAGNIHSTGHSQSQKHEVKGQESEVEVKVSSNDSSNMMTSLDKNSMDLVISHLSRLSMRLSQLVRLKGVLSTIRTQKPSTIQSDQAQREQLAQGVRGVVQTVFSSMSLWVLRGHTKGCITCPNACRTGEVGDVQATSNEIPQIFASSDHLVCILRYLGEATAATAASSPPTSSPLGSTYDSSTCSEVAIDAPSCTIVYNLVLACASQLLNLYLTVLDAVDQNLDALDLSPTTHAQIKALYEPDPEMELETRAHLQHVSVVQLCSYFIRRQIRTMSEVVFNQDSPHKSSLSSDEHGTRHAIETMMDLQADVEQSLKRVKEKLCIV